MQQSHLYRRCQINASIVAGLSWNTLTVVIHKEEWFVYITVARCQKTSLSVEAVHRCHKHTSAQRYKCYLTTQMLAIFLASEHEMDHANNKGTVPKNFNASSSPSWSGLGLSNVVANVTVHIPGVAFTCSYPSLLKTELSVFTWIDTRCVCTPWCHVSRGQPKYACEFSEPIVFDRQFSSRIRLHSMYYRFPNSSRTLFDNTKNFQCLSAYHIENLDSQCLYCLYRFCTLLLVSLPTEICFRLPLDLMLQNTDLIQDPKAIFTQVRRI